MLFAVAWPDNLTPDNISEWLGVAGFFIALFSLAISYKGLRIKKATTKKRLSIICGHSFTPGGKRLTIAIQNTGHVPFAVTDVRLQWKKSQVHHDFYHLRGSGELPPGSQPKEYTFSFWHDSEYRPLRELVQTPPRKLKIEIVSGENVLGILPGKKIHPHAKELLAKIDKDRDEEEDAKASDD